MVSYREEIMNSSSVVISRIPRSSPTYPFHMMAYVWNGTRIIVEKIIWDNIKTNVHMSSGETTRWAP